MTSEEEEIALVMQRDHLTTPELRLRREQGTKKTTDRETEEGVEVVQDEFGWWNRKRGRGLGGSAWRSGMD
jgi:hypothetical protein